MPIRRLPIVGVMGSGQDGHEDRAVLLGRWLAAEGVHLLTGGGGGVMSAVSKAFSEVPARQGLVLGIIPGGDANHIARPRAGYPNAWVEVPIYTHLSLSGKSGNSLLSRNHINILSSSVIIVLPGSWGTSSEIALALSYGRPLVAYLQDKREIPDLPDRVLIESEFDGVQRFVRAELNRSS